MPRATARDHSWNCARSWTGTSNPVHWSEKLREEVGAFFRDDEQLSSDRTRDARTRGFKRSPRR